MSVPEHYAAVGGIETMDALRAIIGDDTMFEGFLVGSASKHLALYASRGDPLGDLLKVRDYVERLIALREEVGND